MSNNEKNTIKTDSGLLVEGLEIGDGKVARGRGQTVIAHYRGCLDDGTEFDSSIARNESFKFPLGSVLSFPAGAGVRCRYGCWRKAQIGYSTRPGLGPLVPVA